MTVANDTPSSTPVDIDVVRDRAVTVTFDDGVVCTFAVRNLRAACPCATCRGWRERGEVAWPRTGQRDAISIVDAQLTGAWGLSIDWDDGHSTGIYAWQVLRRWWDGGDMTRPMVSDVTPPARPDAGSADR